MRASRLLAVVAGVVAVTGVLGVVVAAFALSFDAIRGVAVAAHIRPGIAWLFPIAVDGAMSVATVCAVVLRRRGRSAAYPWAVVMVGALVSVVANGLHAWVAGGAVALPAPWAVTLATVPPVLLALSIHLLIVLALSVTTATADTTGVSDTATTATGGDTATGAATTATGGSVSDSDTATATPPRRRQVSRQVTRQVSRRQSSASRVAAAVAAAPGATAAELARQLGLSVRTVQRHRAAAVAAANGHMGGDSRADD